MKLLEFAEDVELRILRRVRSGESRPKRIDPVDLSGGAICGLLRRPSFGFLLLLEAARPGRSFAPASSCLACGDALGLEDIQLVRIITTRVHA